MKEEERVKAAQIGKWEISNYFNVCSKSDSSELAEVWLTEEREKVKEKATAVELFIAQLSRSSPTFPTSFMFGFFCHNAYHHCLLQFHFTVNALLFYSWYEDIVHSDKV